MMKRRVGMILGAVLVVMIFFSVAWGATASDPVKHYLDPGVENVVLWAAAYVLGLLAQKSKVWNEFIPFIRYGIFMLAHMFGVDPAAAGEIDRTVAIPTDPASASILDLAVVQLVDNLAHKLIRLFGKAKAKLFGGKSPVPGWV